MYVSEIKSAKAVSLQAGMSAVKAYQLIQNSDYSKFPVVDKDNKLVGIVTRDELEDVSASSSPFKEIRITSILTTAKVKDVMSSNVFYTRENETLWEAALNMKDHRVSMLPVVDDENRVVSVLARNDLFKALLNLTGAKNSGLHISLKTSEKTDIFAVTELIKNSGAGLSFISYYDGRINLKLTGSKAKEAAAELEKNYEIIYITAIS